MLSYDFSVFDPGPRNSDLDFLVRGPQEFQNGSVLLSCKIGADSHVQHHYVPVFLAEGSRISGQMTLSATCSPQFCATSFLVFVLLGGGRRGPGASGGFMLPGRGATGHHKCED